MNGNNFNGQDTSLDQRLGINERPLDLLSYNNALRRECDKTAASIYEKPEQKPQPFPEEKNWFYVEDVSGENNNIFIINVPSMFEGEFIFEISNDKITWESYTITGETIPAQTDIEFSGKLYIRCQTERFTWDFYNKIRFNCENSYNVGGNILSLLYGSEFTGNETEFPNMELDSIFSEFFANSETLISARDLVLPEVTTPWCYSYMFRGCGSLTEAPELLSEEIDNGSYAGMFMDCSSLRSLVMYASGEWNNSNSEYWLQGVSQDNGILHNVGGVTGIHMNDESGCPTGWILDPLPPKYQITELEYPHTTVMPNLVNITWEEDTDNISVSVQGVSGISYYIYDTLDHSHAVAKSYIHGGTGSIDMSIYPAGVYVLQLIEPKGSEANYEILKNYM